MAVTNYFAEDEFGDVCDDDPGDDVPADEDDAIVMILVKMQEVEPALMSKRNQLRQ